MSDDARIRELVEEALDTGRTPEELCRDAPELLPAVRAHVARLARLSAEVDSLFPPPGAGLRAEPPEVLPAIPGYAVEGVLGRGGMGVVYRARHLKLGRDVALKMLLAGAYAGPRDLARFLEEARAAANLCHPNIVQVFDVGELEGRPYFTMELLAGGTLAELLDGRPQPAAWAAERLALLARAVEFAHKSGVVHRDLKPSNVLLARDGTPKIADFGLARRVGEGTTAATGGALGTPSYMAPEQVRGLAQARGPAVDVYALGAILYEMLTGRPPFRSDSALATQVQVLTADPVPPARLVARVPRDLETICLTCLHKDPARRYATASALADDLARFRRGEPITARPVGALERATRWVRRNPSRAALVVTALALVTLASAAGAREWTLAARERADVERWSARLGTVRELQAAGRFEEARTALARVPEHPSPELRARLARAQAESTWSSAWTPCASGAARRAARTATTPRPMRSTRLPSPPPGWRCSRRRRSSSPGASRRATCAWRCSPRSTTGPCAWRSARAWRAWWRSRAAPTPIPGATACAIRPPGRTRRRWPSWRGPWTPRPSRRRSCASSAACSGTRRRSPSCGACSARTRATSG